MRIDILSIAPSLIENIFLSHNIINKAIEKKMLNIFVHNIRDYGIGKNKKVDDYQYGGGPGMVMRIEPIYKCLQHIYSSNNIYDEVILMSPDGDQFKQSHAKLLSKKKNIIIICGHYKGVDERVKKLITKTISIGKYILSGGELASAVIIDSISRLIPGVLKNYSSVITDSYYNNELYIAPPIYTRPYKYKKWRVPKILLSGDFKKIKEWQLSKSLIRSKLSKNIFTN